MIADWLDPTRMSKDSLRILQQEGLIFEVTELIAEAMQDKGVTKAELAKRLGKSRSFVTQLLDGTANMTLKTVADVFTVMELELTVTRRRPSWGKAPGSWTRNGAPIPSESISTQKKRATKSKGHRQK